tara:strand:+ start:17976 stop:18869 length:894 start_codon:yes stop_codon:yes gene_type:complete
MNIIELIKDKRPNLKDNSLKSYLITLRRLNDNKEVLNLEFLKNFSKIMENINEFALPTQRNKLTAILVVLSAFQKKEFDEVELKYRKELEDRNKEYNDFIATHQKSDKQNANWTSIAELKKIMNQYKKTAKANPTLKTVQPYLVAALYLLQPPKRLDFSGMKIIKSRKDNDGKTNYLLNLGRNKKYFIFNQFKTDKKGPKEVLIPKDINSIINLWLQVNKGDDFLYNSRGQNMTANGLGKYITKIFKPSGKNITLNLLRNIYVTENIDLEAVKKAKEIAEAMDHTEATQKSVYLKKD